MVKKVLKKEKPESDAARKERLKKLLIQKREDIVKEGAKI